MYQIIKYKRMSTVNRQLCFKYKLSYSDRYGTMNGLLCQVFCLYSGPELIVCNTIIELCELRNKELLCTIIVDQRVPHRYFVNFYKCSFISYVVHSVSRRIVYIVCNLSMFVINVYCSFLDHV